MRDERCTKLIDTCKKMASSGLTVGTWGNISIRLNETSFMVTPSGMDYETLNEDDFVVVEIGGEIIGGDRKPSIESPLHAEIYGHRPDVKAIIHTHPVHSTAFALTGRSIPPVSEELVQIIGEGVDCAAYALPGTKELAINTVKALGNKNAVLMANHGAVCVGESLDHALKIAFVLEKAAQSYIYATLLGKPNVLSHEDCEIMRDFVKTSYGQR